MLTSLTLGILLFTLSTLCQRAAAQNTDISLVHLVFMNHLDVGFDGINPKVGFAVNVINTYFDVYFPRAADLADAMRKLPGGRRFIYTTHPWLVDLYTNCPELSGFPGDGTLHCPNQTMLSKVESAIRRGDIVWHAFPFNAEVSNNFGVLRIGQEYSKFSLLSLCVCWVTARNI